ncbi:MAG TPA: hypothetical protein VEK82_02570, partial [Stellaceae bacterium]|nr:hypothetical protein [Stellaceae bacterium]
TRHPRPDVAFLVSRPSHAPNMLMLGRIDSHLNRTCKHTFKTASQDEVLCYAIQITPHAEERPGEAGVRLEARKALMQQSIEIQA